MTRNMCDREQSPYLDVRPFVVAHLLQRPFEGFR
jgi:hypothetical protein